MSISIVTISFNQREYLAQAIESVLSTSKHIDLELIVVDPGSKDGSRELILDYAQYDFRVKKLFENDEGPADGLNKGLNIATKDIVGFINSDDYYLPGTIEEVLNLFESNCECAVLIGNGYKLINNRLKAVVSDRFTSRAYAKKRCNFLQQSTFYSREFLEKKQIKFNVKNRTCWDGEFLFDISNAGGKMKTFQGFWGVFRIHENSISGSGRLNDLYLADRERISKKYFLKSNEVSFRHFDWVMRFFLAVKRRILIFKFTLVKRIVR